MNNDQIRQIQAAQLLATQLNNTSSSPSGRPQTQQVNLQQQQLLKLSQLGLLTQEQLQAIQYAQSIQQQYPPSQYPPQQQQQQQYPSHFPQQYQQQQQQYQQQQYQQQYPQQYSQQQEQQEDDGEYDEQEFYQQYPSNDNSNQQSQSPQQERKPYKPPLFHVYVNGSNVTPGAPTYDLNTMTQKGGIITIPNPHRGPNNTSRPPINVYARFFASFSDGTKIGFLPDRYLFAVNGISTMGFSNLNNMTFSKLPARPVQCSRNLIAEYQASLVPQATKISTNPEPEVEKVVYIAKTYSGYMTKLGWKRNILGQDSWQRRYFTLSSTHLTYSPQEFDSDSKKKHIQLSRSSQVQIVNRYHNALKNRYEGESEGYDGPIGLDNVIELQCPNYGRYGRTFYFIADNINLAREWVDIIQNNINAIPEGAELDNLMSSLQSNSTNSGSSGGFFSNAFSAVGGALSLMANQGDLENPSKSYEFIRKCLNNYNEVSDREVMLTLSQFFNELEDEL